MWQSSLKYLASPGHAEAAAHGLVAVPIAREAFPRAVPERLAAAAFEEGERGFALRIAAHPFGLGEGPLVGHDGAPFLFVDDEDPDAVARFELVDARHDVGLQVELEVVEAAVLLGQHDREARYGALVEASHAGAVVKVFGDGAEGGVLESGVCGLEIEVFPVDPDGSRPEADVIMDLHGIELPELDDPLEHPLPHVHGAVRAELLGVFPCSLWSSMCRICAHRRGRSGIIQPFPFKIE